MQTLLRRAIDVVPPGLHIQSSLVQMGRILRNIKPLMTSWWVQLHLGVQLRTSWRSLAASARTRLANAVQEARMSVNWHGASYNFKFQDTAWKPLSCHHISLPIPFSFLIPKVEVTGFPGSLGSY